MKLNILFLILLINIAPSVEGKNPHRNIKRYGKTKCWDTYKRTAGNGTIHYYKRLWGTSNTCKTYKCLPTQRNTLRRLKKWH